MPHVHESIMLAHRSLRWTDVKSHWVLEGAATGRVAVLYEHGTTRRTPGILDQSTLQAYSLQEFLHRMLLACSSSQLVFVATLNELLDDFMLK